MTTGKIPTIGFKAAAIKFITLLGFGGASAPDLTPNTIDLVGSYVPIQTIEGSVLAAALQGSYVPIQTLEGSVS